VNERRFALIERARRRFATLVTRQLKEKKIGSRFDLAIIPRFPAQQICDHLSLNSVVQKEQIAWRQILFPRFNSRPISQHESTIVANPGHSVFSMIEANVWGLLFYATEISRETSGGLNGIHLNHFLGHLLVFLQHAAQLISKFGYVGPLLVQMRMESICGVSWLYFNEMTRQAPGSELDDDVTFDLLITTDELQQNRDEVAKNLLKYVFFALNWPDAVSSDDMLNLLIRRGYEYNMWE
jgi:hypothetical protein